ncbi:MAG: hypothetical protein RLZZ292_3362, partial [Bacteroidota bacterium]
MNTLYPYTSTITNPNASKEDKKTAITYLTTKYNANSQREEILVAKGIACGLNDAEEDVRYAAMNGLFGLLSTSPQKEYIAQPLINQIFSSIYNPEFDTTNTIIFNKLTQFLEDKGNFDKFSNIYASLLMEATVLQKINFGDSIVLKPILAWLNAAKQPHGKYSQLVLENFSFERQFDTLIDEAVPIQTLL